MIIPSFISDAAAAAIPGTKIILSGQDQVIPRHRIADWLLVHIDRILDWFGLEHERFLEEIIYIIIIAIVATLVGLAVRFAVLWTLRRIVATRDTNIGRQLLRERTLSRCSHIITPLVFMGLIPFAFGPQSAALNWIMRIVGIYAIVAFAIGFNAVLTFVFNRYNERANTRNLPIKGILNIAKGLVWIVIAIIAVSIIIDKSPATLLAGLGAFAAALMLIFKDSILGFTAGIQMSQNDMLHKGDWIVVPGTPANGIVLDVSLTTVKVQNFDNTIVTVPPYQLVQNSFQNWRGMSDSGVRRIMQQVCIDYDSIAPVTPQLIAEVESKFPEMKQFIETAKADKLGWTVPGGLQSVKGTVETNLGLFRAYLCRYLVSNPHIAADQRVMVRLLAPDNNGYPLQIWCFTNTTDFDAYEAIQSAVLEHIFLAAGYFGLNIYSDGNEDVTITDSPFAVTPFKPTADTSAPAPAAPAASAQK